MYTESQLLIFLRVHLHGHYDSFCTFYRLENIEKSMVELVGKTSTSRLVDVVKESKQINQKIKV